jgi:hypothetical protein
MSFILDALKKLEQKRLEGTVPDLTTIHVPKSVGPRIRPYILYLLIIALILNAAILTIWLGHSEPDKEESTPLSTSAQEPADLKLKTASLNLSSPDEVKTTSVRKVAPSDPSTPEKAEEVVLKKSPQAPIETGIIDVPEISPDQEKNQVQETGSGKPEEAEVRSSSLNIMPTAEELSDLKDRIKEEREAVSQPPAVEAKSVNNTDAPDLKILELHQLPVDVKKDMPKITITGHIYSNSPSSRLVNINGIIGREGDTVKRRLKVTEITDNAVVFDFKGHHFRIRAF